VRVREDTVCHAREESRTIRRPFLDDRELEREAEHGGDDLQPETAAGATAGNSALLGLDAEMPQEFEGVAQAVGDALQNCADESTSIMAKREAGEGATRVRVGMGSSFAWRYGRNVRPSTPALQLLASAVSSSKDVPGASASRSQRSEPAAFSITPIASHVSGTAWQKAWTRAWASWA